MSPNKKTPIKRRGTKATKTAVKKRTRKKTTSVRTANQDSKAKATAIFKTEYNNITDIISCSLDKLIPPVDWNRDKPTNIKSLVASMGKLGQLTPIVVMKTNEPYTYQVVDGMRRVTAAKQLNLTFLKAIVKEYAQQHETSLESMATNLVREEHTASEIARHFNKFVTEYGMTNEQIAASCGKTAGYVSQHLSILKSDKKLQKALQKGTIPLAVFRHINKVKDKTHKKFHDKMVEEIIKGMPAATLERKIDAYLDKKATQANAKAAKDGKKITKKPSVRGAAAHKRKRSTIKYPDYNSPEIIKNVHTITKQPLLDLLTLAAKKATEASKKDIRLKMEGAVIGLEIAAGLRTDF